MEDERDNLLQSIEELEQYELPSTHFCLGWSRGREKFQGKPDTAKGSFVVS